MEESVSRRRKPSAINACVNEAILEAVDPQLRVIQTLQWRTNLIVRWNYITKSRGCCGVEIEKKGFGGCGSGVMVGSPASEGELKVEVGVDWRTAEIVV